MTQALITVIVKKALADIRDDPQRNTRNLVDMALNFTNGRFQKSFFETAREMLQNKHSSYYKLIQDLAFTADDERLLTFGMNVGYMSCTLGASTIRKLEKELMFNIPWSITLMTDLKNNPHAMSAYHSVIHQGKSLGIYTWLIFSSGRTNEFFSMIRDNPSCAFVLFCHPREITEDLLAEAEPLHNLMFSIQYGTGAGDACQMLRRKGFLYSAHISYTEKDAGLITSGGFLCCVQELHPVFAFFLPHASCPEYVQQIVYSYIHTARSSQKYQTLPLDLVYDNRRIDGIISDDICTAFFDSNGSLLDFSPSAEGNVCNLFENSLSDIFRYSFPKSEYPKLQNGIVHA